MNYEILEHTADIKLRVYGDDLIDLLEKSAYSIADLIYPDEIKLDRSHGFEITGDSDDQILVRLLNELVYILQTKKLLFKFFNITKNNINSYFVDCRGTEINSSDEFHYDIKAVTYHDLLIEKTGDKYKAEFVIDV